jgi:hypothetical protein
MRNVAHPVASISAVDHSDKAEKDVFADLRKRSRRMKAQVAP